MNENFDIIFLFAPILLIISFVLSKILSNKRANDDVRAELERAKKLAESANAGIKNAQESTERIECTNRRIEQSITESQRIIEEIKKQRIEE